MTPDPTPQPPSSPSLSGFLRTPFWIATVIIALFFGGLGGWAAFAPLAGAAIAPGIVSPDIGRRTVQHLEGGIIRDLHVTNGSEVAAGDVLVVLDDAQARATYGFHHGRMVALSARLVRLRAQQAGQDRLVFPDWLVEEAETSDQSALVLEGQVNQFRSQAETHDKRKRILAQRGAQLQAEITGLEAMIASLDEQLALIDEEVEGVEDMVNRGLERKPRLLSLQRHRASLRGQRAEHQASIARAEQSIGETQARDVADDATRLEDIAAELEAVRSELSGVLERVAAADDVLKRLEIRAPVSGVVVNQAFTTQGAVLSPGAALLDIVPAEEDLLIDARLSPNDVDVVRVGLKAVIHLSAYAQRNLPRIEGELVYLSADSLTDPVTGGRYFAARLQVDPADAETLAAMDVRLLPGMPAEAMILTGERTALDYLLRPLTDILRRGMRES
ncbi:MAG: HlyD family type I secretion periplasmic adaptor subunit [Rhodospirillaceae bacterium]